MLYLKELKKVCFSIVYLLFLGILFLTGMKIIMA